MSLLVYVCKLDSEWDEVQFQKSLSRVDATKKARILRFVHKKDAWRSLLADMLLRKMLCERFQIREDELVYCTNEYGKPYLLGRKDIFFNLTHSGDWVGCAAGRVPVGVDIERVKPIELGVAKKCFSSEEYSALMAQLEKDRLDFFYELWTLKESYIKAIGKGMSLPLQSFTVRTREEASTFHVQGQGANYFFKTYVLEEGYKMAVCSIEPLFPDKLQVIEAKLLVN
ncbi:4'-phosphopantetheinyl transferase family protein [Brevibacillus sp. SYSU BS000544]|uniref:4'-phosphopantetheinyl transferase family protein n=1 Tax=Brevibacillus sp. SYSU BS000544 TaxID=3416443 RepID=UPI003CE4F8A2